MKSADKMITIVKLLPKIFLLETSFDKKKETKIRNEAGHQRKFLTFPPRLTTTKKDPSILS
jgi:hypothetical protein